MVRWYSRVGRSIASYSNNKSLPTANARWRSMEVGLGLGLRPGLGPVPDDDDDDEDEEDEDVVFRSKRVSINCSCGK